MAGKASDIEGTRDDNTMNIEGEGADDAGKTTQQLDDQLIQRSANHGGPRVHPCTQYGHHPKYLKADDDREYECSPRVCRHCGVEY